MRKITSPLSRDVCVHLSRYTAREYNMYYYFYYIIIGRERERKTHAFTGHQQQANSGSSM